MTRTPIILALLCASTATAAPPPVQLEITDCAEELHAEVEHVVAIELGSAVAPSGGAGLYATVRCAESVIVLHVDDPLTHRSLWRRIALPADARLVALALVELVTATTTELAPTPPPPEPPRPSAAIVRHDVDAVAIAPVVTQARTSPLSLAVAAGLLHFRADASTLRGIVVAARGGVRGRLGWLADGQLHGATRAISEGQLGVSVSSLGAGARWHAPHGRVRFELAGGLRAGAVRMRGMAMTTTAMDATFTSAWLGAFAATSVGVALGERLTVELTTALGSVLRPVTALVDGRSVAAVDGSWLEARLGISVQL